MRITVILLALALAGRAHAKDGYYDTTGHSDAWQGGVRMIPITTPAGNFRVWTKRVGNNPKLKVLLLHGGPAATHEYFEVMDSYLPAAGVEFYYYDQLGSAYSDQPTDTSLWNIPRFVDEVEQVRKALGLDEKNFVLLGHSWGGILAIEYALAHPEHLKGLVISNMMSSIPAYNRYAHEVLMPAMPPDVLKKALSYEAARDYENPEYMNLLLPTFYAEHFLRRPPADWPEPVTRSFGHINRAIYVPMQGPSEMAASGKLGNWDRSHDLGRIKVPTLVIGAGHDTMDPKHMEWMAKQFPRGRFVLCPEGGHMALYDDPEPYFKGLLAFLKDVEGKP
jgi:proline iminopeptidase